MAFETSRQRQRKTTHTHTHTHTQIDDVLHTGQSPHTTRRDEWCEVQTPMQTPTPLPQMGARGTWALVLVLEDLDFCLGAASCALPLRCSRNRTEISRDSEIRDRVCFDHPCQKYTQRNHSRLSDDDFYVFGNGYCLSRITACHAAQPVSSGFGRADERH